jgi:hypothetical protein
MPNSLAVIRLRKEYSRGTRAFSSEKSGARFTAVDVVSR